MLLDSCNYNTELHNKIALHCTATLHCTALQHCTVLYCTALQHCTALITCGNSNYSWVGAATKANGS